MPRTQPNQPKPLFDKHSALEACRVKEQIKSPSRKAGSVNFWLAGPGN